MATTTAIKSGSVAQQAQLAAQQKKQGPTMQDYIKKMEGEIAKALPSVITCERFTRMILSALSTTPKLAQCTPQSFLGAMMSAAQLGLEPNTPLGQAYLIPRNNNKKGCIETVFEIGYKGLIDLAYRSGMVSTIGAWEVRENDEFEYELGVAQTLRHVPAKKDRGEPIAYYAVLKMKDGGYSFCVMTLGEVKAHAMKYSESYKKGYSSPWQTNFDEMAKKGLALETPIPTPHGWATMNDLRVGDTVYDMNGKETEVIAVSEIKHLPCYKITFSDGESIVCDDEHRWVAGVGTNAARDVREKGWITYTINELYDAKKEGKSVTVPVTPCLECAEKDLQISPWMLGYWLGNGGSWSACVSCDTKDAEWIKKKIVESGFGVGAVRKEKRCNGVSIGVLGLKEKLRKMNLLRNKHVPAEYMRASVQQRSQLLCGLMDSDGCMERNRGRARFDNTNKKLACAVFELAISLGEQAHMVKLLSNGFGKKTEHFSVEWQPRRLVPATLPRKAEKYKPAQIDNYRTVKSIEKVESVATKCIAVSSATKTYLAGKNMVPTHNTVLKKLLKYSPLKSDFARAVTADETVKTTISADMYEEPAEYIVAEGTVDEETGEILPAEGVGE